MALKAAGRCDGHRCEALIAGFDRRSAERMRISSCRRRVALSSATMVSVMLTLACGGNPAGPSPAIPSAATFTTSTLSFRSDPQDFIGQGQPREYTLQNAAFRASAARSGGFISLAVQPMNEPSSAQWTLVIIAPSGPITAGSYDTTRLNTSSTYGLDFVGNQHTCNTAAGHVVIHSVEFGADLNSVKHFRASFENHCNGSSAALHGEVAVLADPLR
jgi:hypothetical protein